VQEYIRHYIRKVVKEWGFDLIKVDFSYFALSPKEFQNSNYNGPEALRLGYKIIREEAGPDVFIFGIGGPIGLHWGDVDGERIGLDTLPRWGIEHAMGVEESGVEPSFRCFARRYYMHNHLWINHLDCLCFRGSLKRHESLCLANAMALLGGIWKIGDKVVNMKPEDIAVEQKMLPVFRQGARPIDLFRKLIPEILALQIRKPSCLYHVVGVFHWGNNQDLLTGETLPDSERSIILRFSELNLPNNSSVHVFDFWAEQYLGLFTHQFEVKLFPHQSRVFALHEAKGYPQFLSSNRHINQGALEIEDVQWHADTNELCGTLTMVKNFEHNLFFFVPDGFRFINADFEKMVKFSSNISGNVLILHVCVSGESENLITCWKLYFNHNDLQI